MTMKDLVTVKKIVYNFFVCPRTVHFPLQKIILVTGSQQYLKPSKIFYKMVRFFLLVKSFKIIF